MGVFTAPYLSSLFADAALPTFFGAVPAILTILAGMARIGTCAGRCENVERKLIEEKNRQQELRQGDEEPQFQHRMSSEDRLGKDMRVA
jgi:hypothetical protein